MGRISVLFLAAMILAVTVGTAETSWSASPDEQRGNREVWAESLPNDPYWAYQWGLKKIEADWAWNTTVGTHDVLLAVIDSGIDYTHPDLAANYAPLGYDWVNNDTDPMDDYGHGTRVTGVVAAVINNGIGIAGLSQVRVMAEKVLDEQGGGYVDQLAEGIYHATNMGAKIISMSLSTLYNGSLLYDAVKYAYDAGVLLVAAAGNQANDTKRYPAAYDEVIAVTSTDQNDQRAVSSNYGDWIELAAPGVNIITTVRGGSYDSGWSGTSYACPHVSGLAALLRSEFPNATRDWVRTRLSNTTDDLGEPGFDEYYGYGRINARKAIYGTSPPINYTLEITTTTGGTTNPPPGNYTYSEGQNVLVQAVPNTGYGLDHWELDEVNVGSTNPYSVLMNSNHMLHVVFRLSVSDIAIANLASSKTVVGQGYSVFINVTIANQGDYPETFNVTAYTNSTSISTQTITLTSGNSTTITFTWNTAGYAKGKYTISAIAEPVPGETNTSDNSLTSGWVIVAMVGDINGPDGWPDGKVDIRDVALVSQAFGSIYTNGQCRHPTPCPRCPHNPNTDINNDLKIDIKDIAEVSKRFGKTDP